MGNSKKPVYSLKMRAGKKRTYFFDVRPTRGDDFFITITESKRRFNGEGYERHKLFLYKEDFNDFLEALENTVDHVKTELLPDYDFDEFKNPAERQHPPGGGGEDTETQYTAPGEEPDEIPEEQTTAETEEEETAEAEDDMEAEFDEEIQEGASSSSDKEGEDEEDVMKW